MWTWSGDCAQLAPACPKMLGPIPPGDSSIRATVFGRMGIPAGKQSNRLRWVGELELFAKLQRLSGFRIGRDDHQGVVAWLPDSPGLRNTACARNFISGRLENAAV